MTKTRLGLHSHLNTKGRGIITQFYELLESNNSFGHLLSFANPNLLRLRIRTNKGIRQHTSGSHISCTTRFLCAAYEPLALAVTCCGELQNLDLHFTPTVIPNVVNLIQSVASFKLSHKVC